MVIQRWQSLLLFVAALIVGAGLIFPIGTLPVGEEISAEGVAPVVEDIYAFNVLPLFILLCLTALLLIVDIFLYKNLHQQKQVAVICMMLSAVAGVIGAINGSVSCPVMMVVALVFTLWAYMRIKADERLLKSYDRIR